MASPRLISISFRTNLKPLLPYLTNAFPNQLFIKVEAGITWMELLHSYKVPVHDTHVISNSDGKVVSGINTKIGSHIKNCNSGRSRTTTGARRKRKVVGGYVVKIALDRYGRVYGPDTPVTYKLGNSTAPRKRRTQRTEGMRRSTFSSNNIRNSVGRNKTGRPRVIAPIKIDWKRNMVNQVNLPGPSAPQLSPPVILDEPGPSTSTNVLFNNQTERELLGMDWVQNYFQSSETNSEGAEGQEEEMDPPENQQVEDSNENFDDAASQLTLFSQEDDNPDQLGYDASLDVKASVISSLVKTLSNSVLREMKKEFDNVNETTIWLKVATYLPQVGHIVKDAFSDKNFEARK